MAGFLKKAKKKLDTPLGRVLQAVVYAAMLALICVYFAGNGTFIYEAF